MQPHGRIEISFVHIRIRNEIDGCVIWYGYVIHIFGIDGLVWPDNHSNDFELIERASYTPKRRKNVLDYTHFGEEKSSNGCMLLHIHLKKKSDL